MNKLYVIKHDGRREEFNPLKTYEKIQKYSYDLDIDIGLLTQKVISGLTSGIKTSEIDMLTSSVALHLSAFNTDYEVLSYRIARSSIDRDYPDFEDYIKKACVKPEIKERLPLYKPNRPFETSYIGLSELIDKYLLRENGIRYEKPEFMYARVAAELQCDQKTFNALLDGKYIHSSPLEFNAGQKKGQFGSCFILDTKDSVHGIDKMINEAINTAAKSGGIGINLNRVRPENSPFNNNQGLTRGIIRILEHIETGFFLFDQSNKRKASIVVYLSPWHGDFEAFLLAGNESSIVRAKSLFYGLWIDDYFMHCVKNKLEWKFIREDLSDYYGDEFVKRYQESPAIRTIRADKLWLKILNEQCDKRTSLYVCFKDHANICSNLKDYGTILSSNLCTEIMEPQSAKKKEIAVCNLATICLSKFIKDGDFDFDEFKEVCGMAVLNINKVIDQTYYSSKDSKRYNKIHRSLGIGLQGYHDLLVDLDIPYDSVEAKDLLFKISEHMYYNCLDKSCSLVEEGAYNKHSSFDKSELAKGILHFEHYYTQEEKDKCAHLNGEKAFTEAFLTKDKLTLDWDSLRERIIKSGVANAHLISDPPTAGTSKILNSSPCLEPFKSLIIKERISGKEYTYVQSRACQRLKKLNLWTPEIVEYIKSNGCLPNDRNYNIPDGLLDLFKTAYQISLDEQIAHRVIRQPFVDQASSFNWFVNKDQMRPKDLNVYYFKCWKKGLKTGSYYIYRNIDKKSNIKELSPLLKSSNEFVCNDDICYKCSS